MPKYCFATLLKSHLAMVFSCKFPTYFQNTFSLQTSEYREVFSCFQGAEKGCIGNEWVK